MQTTLFKSGNSLAVRIPKTLWRGLPGTAVEILKEGDHLLIRPVHDSLSGVLDIFTQFDPLFMAEGRELPKESDREW